MDKRPAALWGCRPFLCAELQRPPSKATSILARLDVSASDEAGRRPADARLAGGVAGVALGLAFGFIGEETSDALILFAFAKLAFFGSLRLGLKPCLFGCSLAGGAFGCFAGKTFLLQLCLLGVTLGAGGKNCLTLGLAGHDGRIIFRGPCLETFEKCLLCFIRGVAPLENVFFSVDSQV